MLKVRMIHGIHEKEGSSNMNAFEPHVARALPQADVSVFSYGFMGFWQARWRNDDVAMRLAMDHAVSVMDRGKQKEVWFTHSNGAAVAYLAIEKYGAKPDMVININPALDRWRTPSVHAVEVAHSEQDRWVDLAQWLPFHLWGDQGRVGYKGENKNTISHNASKIGGRMAYNGHCDMFTQSRMKDWAYFWANRIDERIGVL